MKAEKEHIDELIVSYLSNELDGNAVHELKEWIAASVENEKYFMQRQEIWFSAISVKLLSQVDIGEVTIKQQCLGLRWERQRNPEEFCRERHAAYRRISPNSPDIEHLKAR